MARVAYISITKIADTICIDKKHVWQPDIDVTRPVQYQQCAHCGSGRMIFDPDHSRWPYAERDLEEAESEF